MKLVEAGDHESWHKMKYQIFELPAHSHLRYEMRMELLKRTIPTDQPFLKAVLPVRCEGKEHLQKMLEEVESKGGEGLVLRRGQTFYHGPDSIYKYQREDDLEAEVSEFKSGELTCKMYNSKLFSLKVDPKVQPRIGTVIMFKHKGMNDGVPIDPRFLRFRPDLTWPDVLKKYYKYVLAVGERQGANHKCRGCGVEIIGRDKLRITTKGVHSPPTGGPQPHKFYFCLSGDCLRKGIENSQKTTSEVLPPFLGAVGIPEDVKPKINVELPRDLVWVSFTQ